MPDVVMHAVFGQRVREKLPAELRSVLQAEEYSFAQYGPDPWFLYRPVNKRRGRGRFMHTVKTGRFLMALADEAKKTQNQRLFAYLAGFLTHYALDSQAHPYVIRKTTVDYHVKGCHRAFEHGIDLQYLKKSGCWSKRHPITGQFLPKVRLNEAVWPGLNHVFEEVYAWRRAAQALNACMGRFRLLYRILERSKGFLPWLSRKTGNGMLKSLLYGDCAFDGIDTENESRQEWRHGFDENLAFYLSFSDLMAQAETLAVRMIEAAWDYVSGRNPDRSKLQAIIGNRSYLSGFPLEDERNRNVPSLLPAEEAGP